MKRILPLLLILLPVLAKAQIGVQGLPIDSTSKKIAYQETVQVPAATKAALYSAAREWAAVSFKSAKDVLQMDDKEAGTLIARGYVLQPGYPNATRVWRTVKIYTKEGRYRYEITDFLFEGPYVTYASNGIAEKEIEIVSNHGKITEPKRRYKFLLDAISQTTLPEIESLRAAMNKAGAKTKDF